MANVLVIELEGKRERRRLSAGRLVIGRAPGNDWVIDDPGPTPTLSRRHCIIEATGDGFTVTDLGSTNGTRLNEQPVPPHTPTPLAEGDRLRVGQHMMRLSLERQSPERLSPEHLAVPLETPPLRAAPVAFKPPSGASANRSLDDILAGFGAPSAAGPVTFEHPGKPEVPFADDPLGGLFSDRPPQRPAARPQRDAGRTPGDHTPPHFEALGTPPKPRPDPAGALFPDTPTLPPKAAAGGDAAALVAALLEGAGLPPGEVAVQDPQAFMRDVGRSFAALADGLRLLLAARAVTKNHAGVERTVIRAVDNNPLKYAIDRREALLALLRPPQPGYLPPETAVQAGFRDLQAHELAVLDGMQAALGALLHRFDPEALEAQLADEPALALLLHGGRRARLWELFTDRYADIAEAARRRFMGDFNEAFQDAYSSKVAEFQIDRKGRSKP